MDDELAGVWDDLRERRTPEALEKLVLRYRPLLDEVAGRIEAEWPTPTDQGNLRSYGLFGLIDAIQTWTGPPEDFDAYGRETADRSIREGLERRPPRDGPEPA